MLNFKNSKSLICLLFIFLFAVLPMGNILADETSNEATNTASSDAPTVISNFPLTFFMGPAALPASFFLTGLQSLDILPKVEDVGNIVNPVQFVYSGIITGVNMLIFSASNALISLGQGLLNYVIEANYIGMSVTDFDSKSNTYNPVVAIGWGIVRNVANAALVIGLVIIAINIILGREENKAKQTLIRFIIIALLINFTPVICGFIIDGSNILTKSFMSGGISANFSDATLSKFNEINKTSSGNNLFFASIIFLIFSLISFFIYVLYALLFAARYVILWILVIASPIAFATKVFPQSKYIKKIFPSITYWDDWWESFIQWCVIGIPAGMFIYLSNMMMTAIPYQKFTGDPNNVISQLVGSLFPYIIPLIVLVAGFFISISAGGQVGSYLGGVATGAWAATGGKAMKGGKEWAIGRATAAGSYVKEGTLGMAGTILKGEDSQGNPLSILNKEDRALGRQALAGWTKRAVQETPLKYLTNPPALEKDKEAAMDNYNKNWGRYNNADRAKMEQMLIEKDTSAFLKGAIDKNKTDQQNAKEYQRRLASITAHGGEKSKLDAYLHASGNTKYAGMGGIQAINKWATDNKLDVAQKIQSMSKKEAQEKIGADAIRQNPEILKNLGSKHVIGIMQNGSEQQRRALIEKTIDGNNNSLFSAYLDKQQNIIHDPNSTPEQIREAKINGDRGAKLVNEVYNNSN